VSAGTAGIIAVVAVLLGVRVLRRRRASPAAGAAPLRLGPLHGDVAMIAGREIRERVAGRVLRIGTLLIMAVVAAAIVIPTLTKSTSGPQHVAYVGSLSALQRDVVETAAASVGTRVVLTREPDDAAARAALRAGTVGVVIEGTAGLLVASPVSADDVSTGALLVDALSEELGVADAMTADGLTLAQALRLQAARPIAVTSLTSSSTTSGTAHPTSIIGLILTFVMLSQYNTWVLIGVMEEKSSRVVEVLLAAVRPIRLLLGKIIGIGSVALGQATIIVAFALLVAKAVGSDILKGAGLTTIAASLLWLVLGYAFYCWVFAAAGSTVERQNQVQSLAFPLSLPLIFGYVVSITAASEGSASTLVRVLAYLPPTAPFAMPVLVGLGDVSWWQFFGSALISIATTAVVAHFAAIVYRRAILRTGRRIKLRELFSVPA
jgi:ABC-2 type transport system permease protein